MDSRIDMDNNIAFLHLTGKNDILRIASTSGTINNLNASGDIIFQSLQSTNSLDICNAGLYFKIEISDTVNNEITLENNFFPSLFDSMKLKIGMTEVECIRDPGVMSTMLNLISTDVNWDRKYGQRSGWMVDINNGDTDIKSWDCNLGFYNRNKIYKKKFEGFFPLRNLFGFMQNYNRVLYNTMIEFICHRRLDDKLIFYGSKGTGKLKLTTVELHIPELRLNPKSEIYLLQRIATDKPIKVTYLNRISGVINMDVGPVYSTKIGNLTWKPRYILVCFKEQISSYTVNNNLFIQKIEKKVKEGNPEVEVTKNYYLKSLQIQLNNNYYPSNKCEFNMEDNEMVFPYDAYVKCCNDFLVEPQLSFMDYSKLYPLFCFDVSAQDGDLNVNNVDVTLHITKDTAFTSMVYWCILEEKYVEMKLANGKISAIENCRGIEF